MRLPVFVPALVLLALSIQSPAQALATAQPQTAAATPAKTRVTCAIVHSAAPSAADEALARRQYKEAETGFRAGLSADPKSEDLHLGLVRALIGQDRVSEAQAEASAMLAAQPKSAVAEVAMAEAAFRAGNPDDALAHGKSAVADNPCEARAAAVLADVLDLNAYFAYSAKLLAQAHRLRPDDELIRREWIGSLTPSKRKDELEKYLNAKNDLSADDARGFGNQLEHLKARKPGECRITSSADTVKTKLQPVYGDSSQPVAYGLDVLFDSKRRRMQIDTGASGIVLSPGAARGLGLEKEYRIKTGGVGDEGEVKSYLSHVHSIRIGDVEVADCMVEVMEKSRLDVDGLIGMDVFERWLVTLDYQGAELRLAPLPLRPGEAAAKKLDSDPLPGGSGDTERAPQDRYIDPGFVGWQPMLRIGHEILLPADLGKRTTHFLMMDTGASQSVLSPAFAKDAGKLHGSSVEFRGVSGAVKKVFEVDNAALLVANLKLPPTTFFAFDTTSVSNNAGFEVSGFLGLPTLQRLTISIDYRDNLVKLEYNKNRDVQRF